jgi:hypothetical protein
VSVQAVSRERLGAWLLRCSPTRTDLRERFAAPISSWCVTDNYRSRLIRPGDAVLLWVSGRDRRYVRGIWARGRVTAPADRDEAEPGAAAGLRIGLELSVGTEPLVTDAELRAAGVDDLEVQRMPQGSNPSWVSGSALEQILALA